MINYICDKCDKRFLEGLGTELAINKNIKLINVKQPLAMFNMDLCNDCYEKLTTLLLDWRSTKP